jgi:hypothetical protein
MIWNDKMKQLWQQIQNLRGMPALDYRLNARGLT